MLRNSLTIFLLLTICSSVNSQQDKQPTTGATQPLKVFVLVGQSNMQGHARIPTLEHVSMDPKTKPIFNDLANDDATPKTFDKVWINSLSANGIRKGNLTGGFGADKNKIGPEFAFGYYMQNLIGEPILIIKTAWGGKSLHTDFRPPSAGEFQFSQSQLERFEKQKKNLDEVRTQKKEATGKFYRLMIDHIKQVLADIESTYPGYDAEQGYQLSGFVWFQGWNDMVDSGVYPNRSKPNGYKKYGELLSQFIRDVRKELSSPNLPFVIGVMGVGGPTAQYKKDQQRHRSVHQNFRDAMAAPAQSPEFSGSVATVLTEKYWDQELTGLRSRQAKVDRFIRSEKKEKNLNRNAVKELREKMMDEEFTDHEMTVLKKGVSNLEFHYLGSAKIMVQIGKGFAEKMQQLLKNQPTAK